MVSRNLCRLSFVPLNSCFIDNVCTGYFCCWIPSDENGLSTYYVVELCPYIGHRLHRLPIQAPIRIFPSSCFSFVSTGTYNYLNLIFFRFCSGVNEVCSILILILYFCDQFKKVRHTGSTHSLWGLGLGFGLLYLSEIVGIVAGPALGQWTFSLHGEAGFNT